MSVNNQSRKITVCVRCEHRRPSEHSLFCPECWTHHHAECARIMRFQRPEEYSPTSHSVAEEYAQREEN
jgi:hypothetical protein